MRTAATIALLTAGAILTFAVSARVPGVDLRLAGVFIIAAGLAALLVSPSPAAGWLRRRTAHAGAAGPAPAPQAVHEPDDEAYPAYLLQDPAVLAAEVLNGIRSDSWPDPGYPSPSPRVPRASGRTSGPRPLHSVDLAAGPHQETGPGRAGSDHRDEFGRPEFG